MIGVGVISFARPDYLRRCLASLEAQTDLRDVDFWLFQDGAVNRWSGNRYATDEATQQCLRIFARAKLPNKWSVAHEHNVGVAVNSFEALEELTTHYERVLLLECDVVLSPHWLRLSRYLYADLAIRPEVFSISPGFLTLGNNPAEVRYGWTHMWAEAFLADRWKAIRGYYTEGFYSFVAECDYMARDVKGINALYAEHGHKGGPGGLAWSQDGGRQLAMMRAGMVRAYLPVPRAIGIGREGIHFTPDLFRSCGFDNPGPFIHDADATREVFTWPA